MEIKNVTAINMNADELKQILIDYFKVKPKSTPKSNLSDAQKVAQAFGQVKELPRTHLINRLKIAYECGSNKITQSGGVLAQLKDAGLIEKSGRSDFKITDQVPNTDKELSDDQEKVELEFYYLDDLVSLSKISLLLPEGTKFR